MMRAPKWVVLVTLIVVLILAAIIIPPIRSEFAATERTSMEVEREVVQKALSALIAEERITEIVRTRISRNDFSAWPKYRLGGGRTGFVPLMTYLTEKPRYFYCWDKTGEITRQDKESRPNCP